MGKFLDLFSGGKTCQLLVNLEGKHVERYQAFKRLLEHNHAALSRIADLEQMGFQGRPFSLYEAKKKIDGLAAELEGILASFHWLSGGRYPGLAEAYQWIQDQLLPELHPVPSYPSQELVLPFEKITEKTKGMVGAKAANLALIRKDLEIPVPSGFAITAVAYERFLEANQLVGPIEEAMAGISGYSLGDLDKISARIKGLILEAKIPVEVREAILEACRELAAGNYFAFRINALEDKVMLFEFVNHKRFLRASSTRKIASGRWYNLRVDIKGTHIRGLVDDDPILEYQAGVPLKGYAGLWSKADSVTTFKELVIESKDQKRIISC